MHAPVDLQLERHSISPEINSKKKFVHKNLIIFFAGCYFLLFKF